MSLNSHSLYTDVTLKTYKITFKFLFIKIKNKNKNFVYILKTKKLAQLQIQSFSIFKTKNTNILGNNKN